jgi:S-adenosylmethionine hydrolase
VKHPPLALITDFGEDDHFVASLKGVILKIAPSAQIVDITHHVPSFDIMKGGFILFSCYKYFLAKTIFLVIVDPGVGTSRKILLSETKDHFFIAPDNGVLSFVLETEEEKQIREVTNHNFFLKEQSKTFEGRDKMAPVAAWLSKGVSPEEFGPEVRDYEKLDINKPLRKEKEITGVIVYVDKFGNLMTNIPATMFNQLKGEKERAKLSLYVKNREINSFRENYFQGKKGDLFFLVNSLSLVEIAAQQASASQIIKAEVGDKIRIKSKTGKTGKTK